MLRIPAAFMLLVCAAPAYSQEYVFFDRFESGSVCTQDLDGDGWTVCGGDCCDTPGSCPIASELINPGALEVLNNGVDDDCDTATSDKTAPDPCSSAIDFSTTALELAQAIELCQSTTLSPPPPQRKWGLLAAELKKPDGTAPTGTQLSTMQSFQGAVLANYGTGGVLPQVGNTMAGLSSGRMRDQNDPGFVQPSTGTDHGFPGLPPADYLAAHGGQLPGASGCSGACPAGSGANDGINLHLTIRVPTNVDALALQHRYFQAGFSGWYCSAYNDFVLVLLDTQATGVPADRNIAFDVNGNPLSLNSAYFDLCDPVGCYLCPAGTAQLTGTGLLPTSGHQGAGTLWRQAVAPVIPGETVVLQLMVFDVSDNIDDVIGLFDAFEWIPVPGTQPPKTASE